MSLKPLARLRLSSLRTDNNADKNGLFGRAVTIVESLVIIL